MVRVIVEALEEQDPAFDLDAVVVYLDQHIELVIRNFDTVRDYG